MCKLKWQGHLNSFQISLINLRGKTIKKGKNKLEETIGILTEKKKSDKKSRWVRTVLPKKLPAVAWGSGNKNENMMILS